MKEWSGLERVFRLSLGVQVGANALALLAALEFKQHLQMDLQGTAESHNQPISLSSEEWRSTAGIFDRKAYDRAKAKLEDQGIVRIQREGRVLQVTLWPNLMKVELSQEVESSLEPQVNIGTVHRTTQKTEEKTVDAPPSETNKGVSSIPQPRTSLTRYSLSRSSLTPSSLPRQSGTYGLSSSNLIKDPIPTYNEQRNNEQRNNGQRNNEKCNNDKRLKGIGPKFKQLWESEIGHALTHYEEKGIQTFVRMGFSEEIMIEALRYAVLSDQRHMGYLLGILRN